MAHTSERDPASGYSRTTLRAFGHYAEWYFKRHFNALRVVRNAMPTPYGPGTVLYANHPSWWDPLLLVLFAVRAFGDKQVFAPIDARALERYSILRRVGLFPLRQDRSSGVEFLRICDRLLERPENMIALTAQGRLADARERPVVLRRGLAHVLHGRPERQAVPVAIDYVFWQERLPEALVRFGEPVRAVPGEPLASLQRRLELGLSESLDALAREAMTRDVDAFESLVVGSRQGVGGIYDVFERLRAAWQRRPFAAAHRSLKS
jgi:1-acyl-sn-glycerol-3-phosphate acyltransferase